MKAPLYELHTHESIRTRKSIEAPPHFVSVFHETKTNMLDAIDAQGLRLDTEEHHMSAPREIAERNALFGTNIFTQKHITGDGTEEVVSIPLSRTSCIYAYPFLNEGHGLSGAAERFIPRDKEVLKKEFDAPFHESFRQYWKEKSITNGDEYVRHVTDPEYLQEQYPGEILECKVDPRGCFVGDLEYINRIADDMHRGYTREEAVKFQSKEYWNHTITLEDFLKWYKRPKWMEDGNTICEADTYRDGEPLGTLKFYPIKGAPEELPDSISQPEILIPHTIPPAHIRVVAG